MSDNYINVSPTELSFKFELRKTIPVTIQLTNPSGDRVAFKVKTTSPKKYCVRPSSGIIEPNSAKEVQVILQPQREPPLSYAECRDKFLVQCIKVDASVKEVTSELFDPSKAKEVKQTKLKVVMIPPAKPPSPVPEGNESEPTSPPFKASLPVTSEVSNIEEFGIQAQMKSRLQGLTKAPTSKSATTAQTVSTKQLGKSRSGYGLISLILVAIIAFIIGQLTQNVVLEFLSKLHELKAKYV